MRLHIPRIGLAMVLIAVAACQFGRQPTDPAQKVVQIVVAPATTNVAAGGSQQFTAYGRRSTGDSVAVSARYSATGGTITAAGLYTAGSTAGTFHVIAQDPTTSLADTGTIAVTSAPPPPPPPNPATVANLAVTAVTDSSVTVSFTEVTDGTGQPASYEVRWAAGTIVWGSATAVARGSCATPVVGTAIGAMRTCTVLGLAPATAYQLQLVAFRGTLNVDAVFGALSNVASATTASNLAPVASVTVSPATASVGVGQTLQLTATARDAAGNILTGRTITWTSAAPLVGTVTAGGLVSGVAAGPVAITATSEGVNGSAAVTVTAVSPPPGGWPNEPAGFTLVSDEPFNALIEGGWHAVQRQGTNGSGLFAGLDAAAPQSPSGVLQFTFATGFVAGSEPGAEYYDPASTIKETYFAFWWKPSSPWQNNSNSNVNKMAFLFPSSGDIYIMMQGTGSGYQVAVEPEFPGDVRVMTPNVTATPVALGQWHLIEWYVKYATTGSSRDGVTKWWMDGVLQGSYADLQTPGDAGFMEYQLAPTWGGIVGTKTETDFYWFDHARISRR